MAAPIRHLSLALLVLAAAGCAAPEPDATAAPDAGAELSFGQGKDSFGFDAPLPADASASADGLGDGPDSGATPLPDAATADTCPEAGAGGCPCQQNADCTSSLCLPTAAGPQCAVPCVESCPAGFQCTGVAGPGGDVVTVCVDRGAHLCDPCTASSQCAAPGLQGPACVDRGDEGRFCGIACQQDGECPAGYGCQAGKSAEGQAVQQCQPIANGGVVATCTCSPAAMAATLQTTCAAPAVDAEGQPSGSCPGTRACGPGGLSACSAAQAAETCNGTDDDCDGLVDDAACDDGNACTADLCEPATATGGGACSHPAAPGACDADGNACTEGDACKNGKCLVGDVKDCDDGNPCTIDACDIATGCTVTADDGAPCTDDNACTVGDSCQANSCVPGGAKTCTASGACSSSTCDPASGDCVVAAKPAGQPCDDGSACTSADACLGGSCQGASLSCDDGNGCTTDACDPASGCSHAPAQAPCNDGSACTESDACNCIPGAQGATCKCAGTPLPPGACDDANPCTTDACDAAVGCTHAANQALCDDGNPCTAGDQCAAKACVAGTNTCQCQSDADCAAKEDGDLCNGTLFCDKSKPSFSCQINPATVVTCNGGGDTACASNQCVKATGKCQVVAAADGKSCTDGTACTVGDACQQGACLPGKALSCDDGNSCSDDACDATKGCQHTANASPCNADDNACTAGDACSGLVCLAGKKKDCDDGEGCTFDSCDKATGVCKHDGTGLAGQACDADGNACTGPDKCQCAGGGCTGATCAAGPLVSCDDANPCTTDTCDPKQGCQQVAVADQTPCGANQFCVSGKCVGTPTCGNGKVDQASEQCDDGNNVDGDGCSALCKKEAAKSPGVGDLIFTEILANPIGTESQGEWFEVHNPTGYDVLLTGLTFEDNVGIAYIGKEGVVLPAGGYIWFGSAASIQGLTPDWGYDYATTKIQLANGGDELKMSLGAKVIDLVQYGTYGIGWKGVKEGYSYQLAPGKLDAVSNDSGANWCYSAVTYGAAGTHYGTPGKANHACP